MIEYDDDELTTIEPCECCEDIHAMGMTVLNGYRITHCWHCGKQIVGELN